MINKKLDKILTEIELIKTVLKVQVQQRELDANNLYKEIADCGKPIPQPGDIDYEEPKR